MPSLTPKLTFSFRGIIVALLGYLLFLPAASAAPEYPDDLAIKIAVESSLNYDSSITANDIDVSTINGVVTLSGEVPNLLAKGRAVALAETIRGVRSIVNDLRVEPVSRTDEEVERDVKLALLSDPATDSYEVEVEVEKGVVSLSDTVDSWQEKRLARDVAESVKGVRDVKSSLKIDHTTMRTDSEIAADISETLKRDPWIDDLLLTTKVVNGVVTIAGPVGSLAEKSRVITNAWVVGVQHVHTEEVEVNPLINREMERATKTVYKTDAEIKTAVNDALLFDPRVNSFNPAVTVDAGVVTLTGVVDNMKAKRAAGLDAENTVGVWRVKNLLKVRSDAQPSDEKLAQSVGEALIRDPYIERHEIGVSASKGAVYLTGAVDSYYEKTHAEDVVTRVNGVTAVNNNLVVNNPSYTYYYWPHSFSYYEPYLYNQPATRRAQSYQSDAEIKDDIEGELFWSPFVNSNRVNVSVNGGVATLNGTVDDWSEYSAASENAWEGGARGVINDLNIN